MESWGSSVSCFATNGLCDLELLFALSGSQFLPFVLREGLRSDHLNSQGVLRSLDLEERVQEL